MTAITIVASVILVVGVSAWFLLARKHPERAASHEERDAESTRSDEFYRGVDRPAGPDAEPMSPDELGGDQHPPRTG